jgi:hypothetical protein
VSREPGWVLIAGTGGPKGWHLVDHTTEFGGVVTVCNVRGRVIREDQREIETCDACAEATAR